MLKITLELALRKLKIYTRFKNLIKERLDTVLDIDSDGDLYLNEVYDLDWDYIERYQHNTTQDFYNNLVLVNDYILNDKLNIKDFKYRLYQENNIVVDNLTSDRAKELIEQYQAEDLTNKNEYKYKAIAYIK